jgi:hypothetical protein
MRRYILAFLDTLTDLFRPNHLPLMEKELLHLGEGRRAVIMNHDTSANGHAAKQGNETKFIFLSALQPAGLYRMSRQYEQCHYCGLYRALLPGQDFWLLSGQLGFHLPRK